MSTDYNKQAPAYHGIQNAAYAIRENGAPGTTVAKFDFAKSVSFDPTLDQQPIYMNNAKILTLISDQGYTGMFGTSAQDRVFEKAVGLAVDLDGMVADVKVNSFVRFDFYYEYIEHTASGTPYIVKVWTLNAEAAKPSKAHNTDTNSATIGEYSYPITVYGAPVMDSDGTAEYKDANGNGIVGVRAICLPGDIGYSAFGSTVPVLKMKTVSG